MSDADNQMGGSGGETGPRPGQPDSDPPSPSRAGSAPDPDGGRDPGDGDPDEESKESFPASDPPANY